MPDKQKFSSGQSRLWKVSPSRCLYIVFIQQVTLKRLFVRGRIEFVFFVTVCGFATLTKLHSVMWQNREHQHGCVYCVSEGRCLAPRLTNYAVAAGRGGDFGLTPFADITVASGS